MSWSWGTTLESFSDQVHAIGSGDPTDLYGQGAKPKIVDNITAEAFVMKMWKYVKDENLEVPGDGVLEEDKVQYVKEVLIYCQEVKQLLGEQIYIYKYMVGLITFHFFN